MGDFVGTAGSAVCLLTSAATATTEAAAGNGVMALVTVAINAALLIANAAIEIYRKFRDRDKDLQAQDEEDENKKED